MKICGKCGAVNEDSKVFCIDCGEKLPKPITKEKESEFNSELNSKIDHLHEENDPLAVTLPMKIAAILDVIGAVAAVLVLTLSKGDCAIYALYSIPFLVISFFEAIFPRLGWGLTKLSDILKYNDAESLEPSQWYGTSRKIAVWICFAIGIFLILFGVNW